MDELYNESLSNEWIDWVESSQGSREQEIFPLIKKWVEEIKPKILVDIGCGQGICSTLFNKNTTYIGIDSSSTLLKRAKKLYLQKNRKFLKGDVYKIPLNDSLCDSALSLWVWSHLENINLAADETYRILKSKGRFLMITANPETYAERKTFYKSYTIKNNLLTGDFDLGNGKALTNTTLYLHTKQDIKNVIEQAGFKINFIKRLGKAKTSNKGLYLAIECSK